MDECEVAAFPPRDIAYKQDIQLFGLRDKPITQQDALPRSEFPLRYLPGQDPLSLCETSPLSSCLCILALKSSNFKDFITATKELGAVSWKSSKQDTVADFTTEVEYIAASEAAKEAVWIKKFISELGVVPSISDAVGLYCDNNGAIAQAKEPKSHQRSKHILRRFHLIREIIDRGDVEICKVHTDDNIADPLTKPLAQQKHDHHTESLGIRYVSDWS
ncbi:hypothetical protein V6N13_148647 [Hibiscus sabdariffa]